MVDTLQAGVLYQLPRNKEKTVYYIRSSNSFFDGQRFESLADAKERADKISAKFPHETVDVYASVDRDTFRAVYTPSTCLGGSTIRGTYDK